MPHARGSRLTGIQGVATSNSSTSPSPRDALLAKVCVACETPCAGPRPRQTPNICFPLRVADNTRPYSHESLVPQQGTLILLDRLDSRSVELHFGTQAAIGTATQPGRR